MFPGYTSVYPTIARQFVLDSLLGVASWGFLHLGNGERMQVSRHVLFVYPLFYTTRLDGMRNVVSRVSKGLPCC